MSEYEIYGEKYREVTFTTVHPDGTFFFRAFLDEIYLQLPNALKSLKSLTNQKVYVYTKDSGAKHGGNMLGETTLLIPEDI